MGRNGRSARSLFPNEGHAESSAAVSCANVLIFGGLSRVRRFQCASKGAGSVRRVRVIEHFSRFFPPEPPKVAR